MQTKENLCGFHALFNAIHPNKQNDQEFWDFYKEITKQLDQEFKGELDDYQELQRYHLDYVLNKYPKIHKFLYGFHIIQLSEQEMIDLQLQFYKLRKSQIPELVLICGITIHYVCIIIKADYTITLIDSRPNNISKLMQDQLMEEYYIDIDNPLELKRYKQFHRDLKEILLMFGELLEGGNIIDQYIEKACLNLRESFEEYNKNTELWLQEEYPPPVIRSMILHYIKKYNKQVPNTLLWLLELKTEVLKELQGELRELI